MTENSCFFCDIEEDYERNWVAVFAESLNEKEFHERLKDSDGVCFVHCVQILLRTRKESARNGFLRAQREKLRSLSQELKLFIDKFSYELKDKNFGPESDSWLRAINIISGRRSGSS